MAICQQTAPLICGVASTARLTSAVCIAEAVVGAITFPHDSSLVSVSNFPVSPKSSLEVSCLPLFSQDLLHLAGCHHSGRPPILTSQQIARLPLRTFVGVEKGAPFKCGNGKRSHLSPESSWGSHPSTSPREVDFIMLPENQAVCGICLTEIGRAHV